MLAGTKLSSTRIFSNAMKRNREAQTAPIQRIITVLVCHPGRASALIVRRVKGSRIFGLELAKVAGYPLLSIPVENKPLILLSELTMSANEVDFQT
jgi:hypothetical protein